MKKEQEKKTIAVIFGGCSSEYMVSLQSASAVIRHLNPLDYALILIGITQEGIWYRYEGELEHIADDTWTSFQCTPALISPSRDTHGLIEFRAEGVSFIWLDAVFPVLHGRNGEDGTVQGLLELSGIPIIGCDMSSSVCCMDKDLAHKLVAVEGIAVPRSVCLCEKHDPAGIIDAVSPLQYPLFVKPARAGSSYGITRVSMPDELLEAVELASQYDRKIIIEEEVRGFEVGCAVMGSGEALQVGEVDEIELQTGFFNYTEKYTLATSHIHLPARIPLSKRREVQETAKRVYQILGCQVFARVDFFLRTDGVIVFNEVNTIPGFTSHSRYPNMMMQQQGISFSKMVNHLAALVVGV